MKLSSSSLSDIRNRFVDGPCGLLRNMRRVKAFISPKAFLRLAVKKRRFALLAMLLVAAGCNGRCSGGGVILPRRVSVAEAPNTAHVLQAEPAVSFFGGQSNPFWIVCHNDGTHRGDADPNASGITCESQDQRHEFSLSIPVTGQAPFATGDPIPSTDPTLARDPSDPNVVWLAAIMDWDTLAVGKRQSIGVAKLVRDPATGAVTLNEPDPGAGGDAHRMVPIAGTNIEGPVNANNGPSPDRPFIAIDPTEENGGHNQYIAFFQNDNSTFDQNQVRQRRGRIMVTHRNDHDRFWSNPVVVRAEGVDADADGFALDNDSFQFLSPQIAIRPGTHEVGVAFVRFQFSGDPEANITLDNMEFIGNPISYFFGISADRASTAWTARSVTSSARAGNVNTGPATTQFTAAPYPALAFDEAFSRWVIVFTTTGTPRTPADTGNWELDSTFSTDGSSWSAPIQVNNSPRLASDSSRNAVFPALAFDSQARRLTAGYLESNDVSERTWRPVINFSSNGGDSWEPAHEVITASEPRGARRGEYTWGGHWAGSSRAGFFGDYTGLANFHGSVFFAWTESRESTPSTAVMDVWGAEINLSD